jgi:hypothetical protein
VTWRVETFRSAQEFEDFLNDSASVDLKLDSWRCRFYSGGRAWIIAVFYSDDTEAPLPG